MWDVEVPYAREVEIGEKAARLAGAFVQPLNETFVGYHHYKLGGEQHGYDAGHSTERAAWNAVATRYARTLTVAMRLFPENEHCSISWSPDRLNWRATIDNVFADAETPALAVCKCYIDWREYMKTLE